MSFFPVSMMQEHLYKFIFLIAFNAKNSLEVDLH